MFKFDLQPALWAEKWQRAWPRSTFVFAGCWMLASGCWLLAGWLLADGCWLRAARWLMAGGCWLLAAGRWECVMESWAGPMHRRSITAANPIERRVTRGGKSLTAFCQTLQINDYAVNRIANSEKGDVADQDHCTK